MIDILKAGVILYAILAMPFMAGMLYEKYILKVTFGHGTFVRGSFAVLTLFLCEAVPMILLKKSLSDLRNLWVITMALITLAFLALLICLLKGQKLKKDVWKEHLKPIIFGSFIIILSLLFVQPRIEDDTTEIVVESYVTDTMYQYQPYTDGQYSELPKDKVYSPIEMYYAVLADMVKAHPAIVVKMIVPVFVLTLFFCIYSLWAKVLFGRNKSRQVLFFAFIGIIYILPILSANMRLLGIFQNPWRGEIIATTIVFPYICYRVYQMMGDMLAQWNRKKAIQYGLDLLNGALAAQLVYSKGCLLSGIAIISGVLVIVARRCWDRYATDTDDH